VNEGAPHTPDAPVLRAADIAAVVRAAYRPVEQPAPAATGAETRIAGHVAALVEDGSTLQMGLGTLPEAIVRGLADHPRSGRAFRVIGDAVAELAEAGRSPTPARRTTGASASAAC